MTWHYNNKPYTVAPQDYAGFVYEIQDTLNNRLYIGKKLFWHKIKLPPLKSQTRKRSKIVESDWQTYYGSNTHLQAAVAQHGAQHFHRRILYLCKNKTQMSYFETREQFARDVLLDDRYYNGIINCRINSKGLK